MSCFCYHAWRKLVAEQNNYLSVLQVLIAKSYAFLLVLVGKEIIMWLCGSESQDRVARNFWFWSWYVINMHYLKMLRVIHRLWRPLQDYVLPKLHDRQPIFKMLYVSHRMWRESNCISSDRTRRHEDHFMPSKCNECRGYLSNRSNHVETEGQCVSNRHSR